MPEPAAIHVEGYGSNQCELWHAEIVEAVCAPGFINAEVLFTTAEGAPVDPATLLHKNVLIELPPAGDGQPWRKVRGIVWQARAMGAYAAGDSRQVVRLVAVPPIMLLSLRRLSRSFSDMTASAVCSTVLDEWSTLVPFGHPACFSEADESCSIALASAHQSQETDLQFLLRMLRAHGVFWFNDSSVSGGVAERPMLMLGTDSTQTPFWHGDQTLTLQYDTDVAPFAYQPAVLQWTRHALSGPRNAVVSATQPMLGMTHMPENIGQASAALDSAFKGFDWFQSDAWTPQQFNEAVEPAIIDMTQTMQSRVAAQLEQAMALDDTWATGIATTTGFAAGCKVKIADLPGETGVTDWFVCATRTIVSGPGQGRGAFVDQPQLLTSFRAIPANEKYRPPLHDDRLDPPTLHGSDLDSDVRTVLTVDGGGEAL